jgi:ATP/maltotriose-dependent transcriptional regulator MalT
MTLPRSRLLSRMVAGEPRLVRLCAPAGYGKSSLARLYARRFDRHSICDCAGVRTATEFAGRALCALAGEYAARGGSIAATRLRLHATQADEAAWCRALLDAWKSAQGQALFVLERAEEIGANDGVLALVGDLLAARPPQRVMLVCTRAALPLRYPHYLEPHDILTLSREDLRVRPEEAAGFFEGAELVPPLLERIVALADGWPAVLLLLALFAQYDAQVERLIDRLERAPFERLHERLTEEVLSAFTPEMLSTILTIAAIPGASLDDIAAATGIAHVTPIVDRLLRLPGFVSSETGAYHVHPLVVDTLRARYGPDRSADLLRAAARLEDCDPLRAAELYGLGGDGPAAAAALDRLAPAAFAQPSGRLIDALGRIDVATLCAHPNLWIALLETRREDLDAARLYAEGVALYQALPPNASAALGHRLQVRLAMLAQELQRLGEARRHVEAVGAARAFDETPEERRRLLMTSALVAAKQGRFSDADRYVDECDAVGGSREVRFDAERATIELERARFLGDWLGALRLSEEALYAAQRSGLPSRIVDAARRVALQAWFCNDDERVAAAGEVLEDYGAAPEWTDAMACWREALTTANSQYAKDAFDRAIAQIDESENDLTRVAIRVSAALLLPAQHRRLLEARAIALGAESSPLAASLDLLVDSPEASDYGIFEHLAARVARSPLWQRNRGLHLGVVRAQVRRGEELLHVSDRGLELLAALALLPAESSKADVAAAIWPELDGEAALNALKMCVSRTRAQLVDKSAISNTKRGYALGDGVTVDARELEALLARVQRGRPTELTRREIVEALRALEGRERRRVADWAWFAPHASRLDELQREFTLLLARGYPGVSGSLSAGSSNSYRRAL